MNRKRRKIYIYYKIRGKDDSSAYGLTKSVLEKILKELNNKVQRKNE